MGINLSENLVHIVRSSAALRAIKTYVKSSRLHSMFVAVDDGEPREIRRRPSSRKTIKSWVRKTLYGSGVLAAYHYSRNREKFSPSLCSIGFCHTVPLTAEMHATPEYTLAVDLFRECLAFFRRHYTVVTLDDVLASLQSKKRLPSRPLLITFDDGWSDTLHTAAPILAEHNFPAVCFIASDAIDEPHERWWQDAFTMAWRAERVQVRDIEEVWSALQLPPLKKEQFAPPNGIPDDYLLNLIRLHALFLR